MSKLSRPQEAALRSADRSGRFFADPRTVEIVVEWGFAIPVKNTYGRQGFLTDAGRAELERLDRVRTK